MFDYTNKGKWWDIGVKVIQGCTRVSEGCKNCWSLAMEKRFKQGTDVTFHFDRLDKRLNGKPKVFSIWNDLFHEHITYYEIDQVFETAAMYPQHIFLILTKRPKNALAYFDNEPGWTTVADGYPLPNVWIGVSVENQQQADERLPRLIEIPAAVRFVSCEPLLDDINLRPYFYSFKIKDIERVMKANPDFLPFNAAEYIYIMEPENAERTNALNWIIAGAETGTGKRSVKKEWIESLHGQCKAANVPFFDKQNILGSDIREIPYNEQAGNPTII